MSKSYHKHYSYATGKNTEYFRRCSRQVRSKNKQMLRDLVPVSSPDTLDEVLYHVTKRGNYDLYAAPADYRIVVTKRSFREMDEDARSGDPDRQIARKRRELIVKSRLAGFTPYDR